MLQHNFPNGINFCNKLTKQYSPTNYANNNWHRDSLTNFPKFFLNKFSQQISQTNFLKKFPQQVSLTFFPNNFLKENDPNKFQQQNSPIHFCNKFS